jgi:carbon starvation protein CstA
MIAEGVIALIWATLAMVMLWTAAMYLVKEGKFHWVATVPAVFMTVVVTTFIASSGIGFNLSMALSTSVGIGAAVISLILFFRQANRLPLPPKSAQDPVV